jgi:hypothetical protein
MLLVKISYATMPVDNRKHYIIFCWGNGLPAEKERQTRVRKQQTWPVTFLGTPFRAEIIYS